LTLVEKLIFRVQIFSKYIEIVLVNVELFLGLQLSNEFFLNCIGVVHLISAQVGVEESIVNAPRIMDHKSAD
jgi:hypothetical protein